ncbi:RNase adaptor protein for sRNA GlmZ degradation [Mucilaginibacter sp. UYP27]
MHVHGKCKFIKSKSVDNEVLVEILQCSRREHPVSLSNPSVRGIKKTKTKNFAPQFVL